MYSVNENYDIEVTRGDTIALRIDLDGRDLPDGTDAVMTIKKRIKDEEPVLQKTFDASDEILTVVLTAEETNIAPGTYFWDLRLMIPLEDGGYEVYTPMEYAAFTVLEVVGVNPDEGSYPETHPDLPLIPKLIEQMRAALGGLHPVGSIYISVEATDPSTYFGGTWERIQDTFLLAAGSTYAAGRKGGEATHVLTTSEMPAHTHSGIKNYSGTSGSVGAPTGSSTKAIVSVTANSATTSTGTTGSGQAHNNMPPYLAVYVWKRTA